MPHRTVQGYCTQRQNHRSTSRRSLNVGAVNLYRIARALDMSLSELFAVDDDAPVVESYGGLRVEPFEGDPWDEELLRVPEAVEASRD